MSFETEVSNILNLYMNSSKQSLKSEYEELAVESDPEDVEEERISIPSFHQPKAYRDTIAPLLEHQFSGDKLTVPAMPSPMSVASMPMLIHPNASHSVPSLDLTPEASPNLHPVYERKAAISGTSIQITPEMSPPLPAQSPSFQYYQSDHTNSKIAIEVPDVRDADSWYDQPLSPVSPEEMSDRVLRESQLSAVSPASNNEGYQRQLTFEALAPPLPQPSPNARPIDYYEDTSLPGPSRAVVSEIIDNRMVPPPLDLNRSKSPGHVSRDSTQAQRPLMRVSNDEDAETTRRYASLNVHDPIEGPMRSYLTPPPIDRSGSADSSSKLTLKSEIEEIYRPGSAFSDSTVDSPIAMGKFGKQLKKALKGNFGKKKDQASKKEKTKAERTSSPAPGQFTDDVESYKYGYWKAHALAPTKANNALSPPHRLQSPEMESAHRLSAQDDPTDHLQLGQSERSSLSPPRLTSKPDEWPMTRPTDQNWYEASKQKSTHDSLTSQASASNTSYPVYTEQSRSHSEMITEENSSVDLPGSDRFSFHNRPASRASHTYKMSGSTNASRQSTETSSISRPSSSGYNNARKSAGTPVSYNNDLFEASGGKKRSGFASRLLMTAEEKRKQKVKESIVVVGSARMGGGNGRESGKPLVNI